jgi:hypothetical protein
LSQENQELENQEFEASLGYIMRSCLEKIKRGGGQVTNPFSCYNCGDKKKK